MALQQQARELGLQIYLRYFSENSLDYYPLLMREEQRRAFESPAFASSFFLLSTSSSSSSSSPSVAASIYESARRNARSTLIHRMREFRHSPAYSSLKNELEDEGASQILSTSKRGEDAHSSRHVAPFDSSSYQSLTLKVKGIKKSREIKFVKTENLYTIGRDKSNKLVIEDSRVSRSHARVEYDDVSCHYIDLGSSCGSKLNGKPVMKARLKSGDVLELGQSTLIFLVKQKKKSPFAFFTGS